MATIRSTRPPMQDLDLNSPVLFLCYSDSGAHGPLLLHFDKGKYMRDQPDMSAKIMMPGLNSDQRLRKNDIEGALFQCKLSPSDGRLGGSSNVVWMIDPKYRGKNAPVPDIDQKVGWATVSNPSAGPGNDYEVWPVRGANGQRAPFDDYRFMYYIQQPKVTRRPSRSPSTRQRESSDSVLIRYYTVED